MEELNHLFGSCACERNQYTVVIPNGSSDLAEVFFDNSNSNRRTQAAPITAFLRVPLDWYHSSTYAQFPDETHSSIKRTFNTRPSRASLPPTRRQFCGYCGTHLTAWNEGLAGASDRSGDYVDVTLGSLLNESLDLLETLQLYGDLEEDSASGLDQDEDENSSERIGGGAMAPASASSMMPQQRGSTMVHRMQNRGMPYFEEMVENSRLGRIKRQRGGQSSTDGTSRVEWEVIEMGGEDEDEPMPDTARSGDAAAADNGPKRPRLDL
ncbi:hypothetical protein KC318_g10958 [Hortaea werneckii]|uniref:CENP-V/GFA domain-containing protein n=1 Tax=Hortaea werneckii TaxID=91943 RepID=A0A3M7A9U8_HORWE|nr:hypothetical protein KC334_g12292 [Hortaea werneckii]KAI7008916.1 hypothetical protein KC355_g6751 [Hortaea werneckii]KAI7658903.1 hypothetical protein KC318_g10958 [Hortaea werneckii]RMY24090.1 hypothetical protein D0867_01617 [Hortaea werneckii]RMY40935.1 hypothetical protein D0866_00938 [Hortaea werneckii]